MTTRAAENSRVNKKPLPRCGNGDSSTGRVGAVGQITETLRRQIFDGTLTPGQRLVEAKLTKSLSVSRGPLREALHRLAVEGIVTIQPNKGASVTIATRQEVSEMFAVREMLEGRAARLVAKRAFEPDVGKQLELLLNTEISSIHLPDDPLDFMQSNQHMHDTLLTLSGSAILGRMMTQTRFPQLRAAFFRSFTAEIFEQSKRDHVAVLKAILAGHEDDAETLMRQHVHNTARQVLTLPAEYFADS
ncbi:GntR family transcriptional regulator [Thalassococcus sp. S3]|uniref:GntR family transcriptional regulator n=1 Tax=Thalassococcus sp. S3 TaxID=2017482 RepID=UPI0010247D6E|nr:GntR family transcriptional regulator [Thalassococcus sp. S3]QBF33369.1 GntR family transcriptional regulator [Thalassococcus sp. S3]